MGLGKLPALRCYDELPAHLRDNPHIRNHYRANYSTRECVRSAASVHNESGNVWSHLIALVVMLFITARIVREVILDHIATDGVAGGAALAVLYMLLCAANMGCMLASALFHLFLAHRNMRVFNLVMSFDYFFISATTLAGFGPPVWLVFACLPNVRAAYLGMIFVLGALGMVAPAFAWFRDARRNHVRLGLHVLTGATGVLPAVHIVLVGPLNSATIPFHGGIALMLFTYAAGVLIYATRWPERWFPGRFDLLGASHQLWHCACACAGITHLVTCLALYQQHKLALGAC